MKIFLLISILTIVTSTNYPKKETSINKISTPQSDSTEVVKTVIDFFDAFDNRDLKTLDAILLPTSKIVHFNGVTTNKDEMMKIIRETKTWLPRKRRLSNYEFISDCNLAVVGFTNEVSFTSEQSETSEAKYTETWTFQKIGTSWKPIRITYSKVIADKHSEGDD
jgi:ketosteroid isomerase-like protein